jgi:hypothetical protein
VKGLWIAAGAVVAAGVGVGLALRSSSGDIEVPPKPEGLSKYDSEAFSYKGFVIVLDRRMPDKHPRKWRWRVFNEDAYGDGRELEGKQRASRFGRPSRVNAYRQAVRYIEKKLGGSK